MIQQIKIEKMRAEEGTGHSGRNKSISDELIGIRHSNRVSGMNDLTQRELGVVREFAWGWCA